MVGEQVLKLLLQVVQLPLSDTLACRSLNTKFRKLVFENQKSFQERLTICSVTHPVRRTLFYYVEILKWNRKPTKSLKIYPKLCSKCDRNSPLFYELGPYDDNYHYAKTHAEKYDIPFIEYDENIIFLSSDMQEFIDEYEDNKRIKTF